MEEKLFYYLAEEVSTLERERAAALLSENRKAIFAFSFSRLCSQDEAEDLTNDIISLDYSGKRMYCKGTRHQR